MYVLIGLVALLGAPALLWLSSLGAKVGAARMMKVRGIGRLGLSYEPGYVAAPAGRRIAIQAAGLAASYLLCATVLLVGTVGAGQPVPSLELQVHPGPAMDAGLTDGDRVVAVDGTAVSRWEELAPAFQKHPGAPVAVQVERDGAIERITVTPTAHGRVNVSSRIVRLPAALPKALMDSATAPLLRLPSGVMATLNTLVHPVQTELRGPVAIVSEVSGKPSGWSNLLIIGNLMALVWPVLTLVDLLVTWLLVRAASRPAERPS